MNSLDLPSQATANWSFGEGISEPKNEIQEKLTTNNVKTIKNKKKIKNIAIVIGHYFHYECLGFLIEYSIYYLKKIFIQSNSLPQNSFFASTSFSQNSFSPTLCSGENVNLPTVCPSENFKPVIYLKYYEDDGFFINRKELLNWKQYYSNLFHFNEYNWRTYEQIENDDIDVLFLTTDDDPEFKIEWNSKFKVISINHFLTRRIYNNSNRFLNINIRYSNFLNRNNEMWCFPMFNAISCNEKKKILNNRRLSEGYEVSVVCVGLHFQPHPDQPRLMFKNNDKIMFSVINRKIHHNYSEVSNIKSYEFLNTPLFFNILQNADYFLCFNYDEQHTHLKLSASINLAFSFGARLIIPKEWQDNLNISSAISYDFKDGSFHVPNITNEMIDSLYEERELLINHRNSVLDNAMDVFGEVI